MSEEKISAKPGRYEDISIEDYHNKYWGWSKSALDKVHRSMAHWIAENENPSEQTEALLFGSAFHCAVLTPELFDKEFCIMPICDRRTTVGKAIFAQFQIENIGKKIIAESDKKAIELMKLSIENHPIAKNLFVKGKAENSFFWKDERTGLMCKCRPDYLRKDGVCLELKSTKDASYKEFKWDSEKRRYHVQGAFFTDGINKSGTDCTDFLTVAVEKEYPHNVNVFTFDESAIKAGRITYMEDLDIVKEYQDTFINDRWAGYKPVINNLHVSVFAK